jgi:acetyltransferase-like isoleucine patch superfamily enzyme
LTVRRSFAAWGADTTVCLPFRVRGERNISLGARVTVGEGSWFQTLGDGTIEIGDDCNFSGYAVISSASRVVIEPHVLFARNVHVLDHVHRYDLPDVPVNEQGISTPRPVRIGAGAWIGANVVISPGVTIGPQAVVGANSVVRDDVAPGTAVAGAPARPIAAANPSDPATREGAGANGAPAALRADGHAPPRPDSAARAG